ncbi:MAG: TonB-dependent receptor [Bryobacteraceae bacterium]
MRKIAWAWTALAALGVCPFAFAQVSGRLAGRVTPAASAALRLYLAGGTEPVAVTDALADGYFLFGNLRPAVYDLAVQAPGMRIETIRGVKIDPARETLLDPIALRAGEFSQGATAAGVQAAGTGAPSFGATAIGGAFELGLGSAGALTSIADEQEGPNAENAEISTTLTPEAVRGLPVLERDPVQLLRIQPGVQRVAVEGRNVGSQLITVVNGQRASYASMTLDGISIEENYPRVNPLGSEFNRLFLDQLSEFTVVSSNADPAIPGGSSHVVMVTPSGTNSRHGAIYYYHRDRALAAGNWLDNARGFRPEGFRSGQFGATLAGPIQKDKLLLYANYEGHRLRSTERIIRTLPLDSIRRGQFAYIGSDDAYYKVDFTSVGLAIHPEVQKLFASLPPGTSVNSFGRGDSLPGLDFNTGGYVFPVRSNLDRDSGLARADWIHSERHTVSFMFNQTRDDRDDPARYRGGFDFAPDTRVESPRRVFSASWRWSPAAQWSTEFRAGMHRYDTGLLNTSPGPELLLQLPDQPDLPGFPLFDNPVNPAATEERRGHNVNLQANTAWNHGRHAFRFGYQYHDVSGRLTEYDNTIPTLALGTTSAPFGLNSLPAATIDAVEAANAWATVLAGVTTEMSGAYTLQPDGSYAIGKPLVRDLGFAGHSAYLHDAGRLHARLSLNLGLRWDMFTPVRETRGRATLPDLINGSAIDTLLGDPTVRFAGGRRWYRADRNNIYPNVGLAWDVLGSRSLVLRAGYAIYSVNDEFIGSALTSVFYNPGSRPTYFVDYPVGEATTFLNPNLRPPAPDLQLPVRLSDYPGNIGLIDPRIRTPYIQQFSAGFQKDIRGTVVELRYTGNGAVKLIRGIDVNQVRTLEPEFISDFRRAFDNGRLAAAATGVFNPAYNSAIPGSQPLGVMNRLQLGSNAVRQVIRRAEAAEVAALFALSDVRPLFPNPLAWEGAVLLTNRGGSSYHGLQAEMVRRFRGGLMLQANYAFSKSLGDSQGLSTERYEPYLDNGNPRLERARTPFDLRHAAKLHLLWEPPFRKLPGGVPRRLAEGWAMGLVFIAQSGNPFSILSQRGTFNVSGSTIGLDPRSENNPASSALHYEQLKHVVRFHYEPNGFSVIDPAYTDANGRGAREAGDQPFENQVFFNPGPGEIGGLQPRMFTGPRQVSADAAISKSTRISRTHVVEIRFEVRNVTNTPSFAIQDQFVNSQAFGFRGGVVGDTGRQAQFGIYYRF